MYRQPDYLDYLGLASFLRYGLPLGFEVCPSGFPIVVPIQALSTAVAVGHKFPVQELLVLEPGRNSQFGLN